MQMKFKKFDLEKALAGDKVIDGHDNEIKQVKLFKLQNKEVIAGVLFDKFIVHHTDEKELCNESSNVTFYMAPKIKTYYLGIYRIKIHDNKDQFATVISEDQNEFNKCSEEQNFIKMVSFEVNE